MKGLELRDRPGLALLLLPVALGSTLTAFVAQLYGAAAGQGFALAFGLLILVFAILLLRPARPAAPTPTTRIPAGAGS